MHQCRLFIPKSVYMRNAGAPHGSSQRVRSAVAAVAQEKGVLSPVR
jgi:hypothetical protein